LQRIDAGKVWLHDLIDPSISIRRTLSMSDSDIVKDFLQESYENLDRLDRELVGLGRRFAEAIGVAMEPEAEMTFEPACCVRVGARARHNEEKTIGRSTAGTGQRIRN
jgi:hypothetical protein